MTDRQVPGVAKLTFAVAFLALLVIAALVAFTGGSANSPAAVLDAQAVAAAPVDAAAAATRLGGAPMAPVSASDPLIAGNQPELIADGVDQSRGVKVTVPDTKSTGWLLAGGGKVCLVLPGLNEGTITTNCEDAGIAQTRGVGRITYAGDPTDPKAVADVTLVNPQGSDTPYVTSQHSAAKLRNANASADGNVVHARVAPGEDMVNPVMPAGQQRLFAGALAK